MHSLFGQMSCARVILGNLLLNQQKCDPKQALQIEARFSVAIDKWFLSSMLTWKREGIPYAKALLLMCFQIARKGAKY